MSIKKNIFTIFSIPLFFAFFVGCQKLDSTANGWYVVSNTNSNSCRFANQRVRVTVLSKQNITTGVRIQNERGECLAEWSLEQNTPYNNVGHGSSVVSIEKRKVETTIKGDRAQNIYSNTEVGTALLIFPFYEREEMSRTLTRKRSHMLKYEYYNGHSGLVTIIPIGGGMDTREECVLTKYSK